MRPFTTFGRESTRAKGSCPRALESAAALKKFLSFREKKGIFERSRPGRAKICGQIRKLNAMNKYADFSSINCDKAR